MDHVEDISNTDPTSSKNKEQFDLAFNEKSEYINTQYQAANDEFEKHLQQPFVENFLHNEDIKLTKLLCP